MRIERTGVRVFTHTTRRHRESEGHAHPGPRHEARLAVLTLRADDGTEGHAVGAPSLLRPELLDGHIRPVLVGADATMRESLWHKVAKRQRDSAGMLTDRMLALVECALWGLAGRALELRAGERGAADPGMAGPAGRNHPLRHHLLRDGGGRRGVLGRLDVLHRQPADRRLRHPLARLLENVLRRFADTTPFAWPARACAPGSSDIGTTLESEPAS